MIIPPNQFQMTMVTDWPQQVSSRFQNHHIFVFPVVPKENTIRDCQVLPRTLCPRTTPGDAWQQRRKMVMSVAPHLHGLEALIATKFKRMNFQPEIVGCIYTQTNRSGTPMESPLYSSVITSTILPFCHLSLFYAWIFVCLIFFLCFGHI